MMKAVFLNYDRLPNSLYWRIAFSTAFFAVFVLYVMPLYWVGSPAGIVNDSWIYAVNLAFHQGKIFGSEIIFTYGPLGWLGTMLPTFVPVVFIVLFRLLLCLTQALVFYIVFDKLVIPAKLLFLVFMLYCGRYYNIDATMYLSICCLALLFVLEIKSVFLLLGFAIVSSIMFFVKQNIALINIVLFWWYNVHLFTRYKNKIHLAIGIFSPVVFIVLLGFFLPVQLTSYIGTGLELANYYNDAMAFEVLDSRTLKLALLVLLIFVGSLTWRLLKDKSFFWRAAVAAAVLYVVFKQGFTRADAHQMIFWGALPVIFVLIYKSDKKSGYSIKENLTLSTAMIFAIFCSVIVWEIRPVSILHKLNTGIPDSPIGLPADIKNKIGQETVDLFPGEISAAYTDQLNYQPRPVPQSYSVYTSSLEAANQEFIASRHAPEYIVFRNGTIDDRHPFWDESKVKLSLISKYQLSDTFALPKSIEGDNDRNYLLLQKRTNPLAINRQTILDTLISTNQNMLIPKENKLLLLKADLEYTLLNRVRRFFFHPRFAYITLYYDDHSSSTHRWIPYVMQSGVIINYSTRSATEVAAVFSRSLNSVKKVDSIRVSANAKWFARNVKISLESIEVH